jgi:phage shock protein E
MFVKIVDRAPHAVACKQQTRFSEESPMPGPSRFQQLAADAKGRIREVTPAEAAKEQAAGAVLIDVRETEEFERGHAAGAVHLGRGVLELQIEELVPDVATPILLYCGGGSRSALSADSLQKMGYANVASISSGFRGWTMLGLPTD